MTQTYLIESEWPRMVTPVQVIPNATAHPQNVRVRLLKDGIYGRAGREMVVAAASITTRGPDTDA